MALSDMTDYLTPCPWPALVHDSGVPPTITIASGTCVVPSNKIDILMT